ncbi:Hsp20/alpha crystallin family protein [Candidatus Kryptobacter tengchongensis]|uniref:Hsp20/alpha crystallin family protein n=2 Tax=Kryptobacter tengchongensis TaxID=1643429 RepID=A0A656D656_KRYT1|nr:Hsp20 family protein [Candidatus Kryptobacter tengchongensis]CUS99325.1 Hsp20/alpha crystallin family protein [Candidatus Kryptobacter tengchongensis]
MRSVRLPYPIDVDKVSAEYKDGILKIILPKKEEAKPKEIQINVN